MNAPSTNVAEILLNMENERKLTKLKANAKRRELANKIAERGWKTVYIAFSGGGDSGSIDNIDVDEDCNFYAQIKADPLLQEIEDFAYDYLSGTGVDWYNNDGGQGHMEFNVSTVPYTFECSIDVNTTMSENAHTEEGVA